MRSRVTFIIKLYNIRLIFATSTVTPVFHNCSTFQTWNCRPYLIQSMDYSCTSRCFELNASVSMFICSHNNLSMLVFSRKLLRSPSWSSLLACSNIKYRVMYACNALIAQEEKISFINFALDNYWPRIPVINFHDNKTFYFKLNTYIPLWQ